MGRKLKLFFQAFANQSINGDFPLHQVATAEQFPGGFSLPFWGAAVVAGAAPGALLQQPNQQNGTTAAPPVDNAPLLTPTSPHWNSSGNSGPGIPPPLNTQPVLFQNISDPAQHSPYGLDASILSQSPLFTPANFYSPATPQYPHAAAFSFPPVDWTNPNSMAAASYIGGRNAAGPNLAFFNNIPPASSGQQTQSIADSSINGNMRKVTEGLGQMTVGPGGAPNTNGQPIPLNLPSPRFTTGQLNLVQQIEPNSPNFVTELHNKFFPPIDHGKLNGQQKEFANQYFLQNSTNGADSGQQTYANMLRTGDNALPNPKVSAFFSQGVASNQAASFLMKPNDQVGASQANSLDVNSWESNTSATYTSNQNNMRDSTVKNLTSTAGGNVVNNNNNNNNRGSMSEHLRNKPYPSHQQQQSTNHNQGSVNQGGGVGYNSNTNTTQSYNSSSRAGAGGHNSSNLPSSGRQHNYQSNYTGISGADQSGASGGQGHGTQGRYGNNYYANQGGSSFNSQQQQQQNHNQQQHRSQSYNNNRNQNFNQNHQSSGYNSGNSSVNNANNNNNPATRVYPPPETVHYGKDGVHGKGNTEEHKLLVEKLVGKYNFNPKNFDCSPKEAKFFVIKSYSEDDIHRSIKYSVWCSTENGNKKLDSAFKALKGRGPMYLFFSVNGSGHFCGLGEMKTAVDYSAQAGVWQQDKWKGRFEVKWIFIKDVPNAKFRHIIIEANENKPVTNSRDTQEVPYELGKEMMVIMSQYRSENQTSILDSYSKFESRQRDQMSGGGGGGGYHHSGGNYQNRRNYNNNHQSYSHR